MTTEHPTLVQCPACGRGNTVALNDGLLCLECRYEWNPATERWQPPADPPATATAAEIVEAHGGDPFASRPTEADVNAALDVPAPLRAATAEDAATAFLEAMKGTTVNVTDRGYATVVDFIDDEWVNVRFPDDRTEAVRIDDTTPVADQTDAGATVTVDVPDETAEALARTAMAVAALALNAGVGCIVDEGDVLQITMPAGGWLPDDAEAMPIIEQGVAYAIATLIVSFGIDLDDVRHVAESYTNQAAQAGEEHQQ